MGLTSSVSGSVGNRVLVGMVEGVLTTIVGGVPLLAHADSKLNNKNVDIKNENFFIQFPPYTTLFFCTICFLITEPAPNGLRYLRWGGDGEAVQPEK